MRYAILPIKSFLGTIYMQVYIIVGHLYFVVRFSLDLPGLIPISPFVFISNFKSSYSYACIVVCFCHLKYFLDFLVNYLNIFISFISYSSLFFKLSDSCFKFLYFCSVNSYWFLGYFVNIFRSFFIKFLFLILLMVINKIIWKIYYSYY